MEKGKEEEDKTSMTDGLEDGPTGVTNVSTVRRDTEGAQASDFIMASDGTLGVFDGMGTRGLREGEQELFDSGKLQMLMDQNHHQLQVLHLQVMILVYLEIKKHS